MTLDQYIEDTQAKLEAFKNKWLEGQKSDPANYPADLSPGDWDEQFLANAFDIIP